MQVHLVDGTYELFRHFFAVPSRQADDGQEIAAVRSVVTSMILLLEEGATHVGIATDTVIESFRNELWPTYKSSDGVDPLILSQFQLLEKALETAGFAVFPMVEHEADDALAALAKIAAADERVSEVLVASPDKDFAQLVGGKVFQLDRRRNERLGVPEILEKYGVTPKSIPDWLALVGDAADGFPGVSGWGAKSSATVLSRYEHVADIPTDPAEWEIKVRGAAKLSSNLEAARDEAMLFVHLATLVDDCLDPFPVEELAWRAPTEATATMMDYLGAPKLYERLVALASNRPPN